MNLFEDFSIEELKKTHVDLMGLTSTPWNFSRGAKTTRDYNYPNGDVGARITYTYTYANEGREINQPTRKLELFDSNGVIQLTLDITKQLNAKQLRAINREIRQGRWDYMDDAAIKLKDLAPYVPEPYATDFVRASNALPILHKYYEREIFSYIADGTIDFENVIRNETNPIMLELLALNVRPPDAYYISGLTVLQTLLHQLTGEYNP
jgi:hypothetical protein